MTFKLKIRAPRAGAVHPCPGCVCPGDPKAKNQCAKIVPERTYSKAHRCDKKANVGSLFCSFHR